MKKLSKFKIIEINFKILFLCSFLSQLSLCELRAQVTVPFNFSGGGGNEYLGWSSSVGDNVEITHNTPGESIFFGTDLTERMRIFPNGRTSFGLWPAGVTSNYSAQWNIYVDQNYERGIFADRINFSSILPFAEGLSVVVENSNNLALGIYCKSEGNENTIENIAVSGEARQGSENIGIYSYAPMGNQNFAGYFEGDVLTTNPVIISDETVKSNISPLLNSYDILSALNPVKFNFSDHEFITLSSELQYGFIAQEVQEILPEIVSEMTFSNGITEPIVEETYLSMQIMALIPIIHKFFAYS
ncbi:MAG TPA: tail fiber domain-containing protein [Cryomorphaceae bacterium]|nr:tail fiber domain-containing protein [Cryomorphaceae bacterium]